MGLSKLLWASRAAFGLLLLVLADPLRAEEARLKIGIVADPHLETDPDAASCWHPEDVYRHFEKRGEDGVVMPGDLTTWGLVPQLRNVAAIWKRVFPGNRRRGGGFVEKLLVYGDHDVGGYMQDRVKSPADAQRKAWTIPWNDRKAQWEQAFGESWSPVQVKLALGANGAATVVPADKLRYLETDLSRSAVAAAFAAAAARAGTGESTSSR